jgi:hypothetical protein
VSEQPKRTPTVYIVQNVPGKNLLPASAYGTLSFLLGEGQVTFSIGPTIFQLTKGLAEFKDEDFLLLIGDPIAIGLATAIAARWNHGRVKLLKWDRQESVYIPLQADMR